MLVGDRAEGIICSCSWLKEDILLYAGIGDRAEGKSVHVPDFFFFFFFLFGDYLFSKDIHTTKVTGYHDFNTRRLTKKLLIHFETKLFKIILCQFHLCPFWAEVIRKRKNKINKESYKNDLKIKLAGGGRLPINVSVMRYRKGSRDLLTQ